MENILKETLNKINKISSKYPNKDDIIDKNYNIGKILRETLVKNKDINSKDFFEKLKEKLGKGFSVTQLTDMDRFYKVYRHDNDLFEYAKKLNWTNNLILLSKDLFEKERAFYLKRAVMNKLTGTEIKAEINNETFDKYLNKIESKEYAVNIENIKIKNYKSLVDINIKSPSRFLVFAGANSSGKSNIFEAIEFFFYSEKIKGKEVFGIFGGEESIVNYNAQKEKNELNIEIKLKDNAPFKLNYNFKNIYKEWSESDVFNERFSSSFSRIFINNVKKSQNKLKLHNKLWFDASNLKEILEPILQDSEKRKEIEKWLRMFVPGVQKIEIHPDLNGKAKLLLYEDSSEQAFPENLISEGTYNIIALLTLIYNSNKQQLIFIEEPEIGLNPKVVSEMVNFFRTVAEKHNHYIWLTTHSQSLVSNLKEEELIIVNKKKGETELYQCQPGDFEDMSADEAWLSNMLEGGLPW